jgi:GT2 family glycosyltransferase
MNKNENEKILTVSPQEKSVVLRNASGQAIGVLKVDSALVKGRNIILNGWCTLNCKFELRHKNTLLAHSIERGSRPDVARALKIKEPEYGFGMTLVARQPTTNVWNIELQVQVPIGQNLQTYSYPIELLADDTGLLKFHSVDSDAVGMIESAMASYLTGDVVLVGWVAAGSHARVWLETDTGKEFDLHGAYRFFRQDVMNMYEVQFGMGCHDAGLVVHLSGAVPCQQIKLMSSDGDKVTVLSEASVGRLGVDPTGAALFLFGINSPLREFPQRLEKVDIPVLDALIEKRCQDWGDLPVLHRVLGTRLVAPKVSVIVPLFGRADFVEHQLIEFSRDPWFQEHAELIYVVDDPRLVDTMATQAEQWHRLYRLPFQWMWGAVNRGFSGANNLGVDVASGQVLLFMNSDVIPRGPGWLERLVEALVQNPQIGAVCPRLLFPDGTLQHAGMQFMRREELGIWVNHHSLMGCPPELDPHTELTSMPAVTGACMAMSRKNFDEIGGWDTGYLIGDFEDSEMCFKLRSIGLDVAYLPTVALTHLERQSFKSLGQGDFRQRVVIFNAVRHQLRWAAQLEAATNAVGVV